MAKEQNSFSAHVQDLYLHKTGIVSKIPLAVQFRSGYAESANSWHVHKDFAEMIIVSGGSCCNEYPDNKTVFLNEGDVLLYPAGSCHRFSRIRNFQHYNIFFDISLLNLLPGAFSSLFNCKYFRGDENHDCEIIHLNSKNLALSLEIMENMEHEQLLFASGHEEAMFADFYRLIVLILRHGIPDSNKDSSNTAANRIIRILNYMEEHVTTEMSLPDLSARAGMSESSFRHRFREMTGLPPLDYLIRLRLRRAILQLQYGDRSITQIALESGFSDGNYFARKFRQFFNCTAREFRQACRAGEIELHEYLEKLNLRQIN